MDSYPKIRSAAAGVEALPLLGNQNQRNPLYSPHGINAIILIWDSIIGTEICLFPFFLLFSFFLFSFFINEEHSDAEAGRNVDNCLKNGSVLKTAPNLEITDSRNNTSDPDGKSQPFL